MKLYIKSTLCLLLATLVFVSCDKNDDDNNIVTLYLNQTQIPYDTNGLWSDAMTEGSHVLSQGIVFSHEAIPAWSTWNGFVASRNSDNADYSANFAWLEHQYTAITGGGMSGTGTPYMIAYWNSSEGENVDLATASCAITYKSTGNTFIPQSLYATNTSYAYYSMVNGSDFNKKFEDDDYFHLLIYGVKADGTKTGPITYPLADGSTPTDSWQYVNLEELGEVSGIYFQMDSSDKGIFGINTPTYFAIDRLMIKIM